MKKTFTINISGSVFHIDEDAYEKLQKYLQMLTSHFGTDADGREIMQDIEARISELFSEKMQLNEKDVICESWVDEMITVMGKPEDFIEEEEFEEESKKTTGTQETKIKRRLYRDPESRVFGGVCSGMAAYFDIDKVLMRIIFVLLFFVIGPFNFLIYLVLWIAVPKAVTTAQKLEMRGREANVSNIEKSIKEEVKEVKESYERLRNSESYNKGREKMSRLGDVAYNILKVAAKVLVVILGVAFILFGFVGIVGFLISMVIGQSVIHTAPFVTGFSPDIYLPDVANLFISQGSLTLLMIAIAFLVVIPLLAILFVGTKMVFNYKSNNKIIFLAGLGTWLVALIAVIFISVGQLDNYGERSSLSQSHVISCEECNTLYLELGEDLFEEDYNSGNSIDLNRMGLATVDGESILYGVPQLDVVKSNTDDFVILLRKRSRGKNDEIAKEHVEKIEYNFSQNDSTIYFDPVFTVGDDTNWLDQEVNITVKVPEGKSIYLGDEMVEIIYDIENVSNTWDGDMVGKFWEMTSDGLQEKELD